MNKDNKQTKISFAISSEEKEALIKFCEEKDETMSRVLRKALREYLDFHSED